MDSSEEGGQSDIATREAKEISKPQFHLERKSTARMDNTVTTCGLKMGTLGMVWISFFFFFFFALRIHMIFARKRFEGFSGELRACFVELCKPRKKENRELLGLF